MHLRLWITSGLSFPQTPLKGVRYAHRSFNPNGGQAPQTPQAVDLDN